MEKIIELHEKAGEHLENVKYYRTRQNTHRENIKGFYHGFPTLIKKAKHDIDIYKRCEKRMWERYERTLAEIKRLKIELNSQK